jgi:recombination DNA repair RAD52 pathway protein
MIINQIDENQNSGRVTMGLSVVMRVTLKDGTYHEVRTSLLVNKVLLR